MSDITLPGTIPGLLRRGSPVIAARSAAPPVFDQHALVVGTDIDSDAVRVALLNDERFLWLAPSEVALDLTDATGRAHAAWCAADRLSALDPDFDLSARTAFIGAAMACGLMHRDLAREAVALWPVLDGIFQNDPRLLPDGSRWVDAEALRLVVCHVTGVSP